MRGARAIDSSQRKSRERCAFEMCAIHSHGGLIWKRTYKRPGTQIDECERAAGGKSLPLIASAEAPPFSHCTTNLYARFFRFGVWCQCERTPYTGV